MTGPREWRHADICNGNEWRQINVDDPPCDCGLSAVRDAIAAGHRVVIGPDGALADPAPVGLTEPEKATVDRYRGYDNRAYRPLLAIIDRLSAAPVDDREQEGVVLLDGKQWKVLVDQKLGDPPSMMGATLLPVLSVSPSVDPEEG